LKFILACPYNIHSFYTPQEKVEVRYNGTEALKNQKVDVYLVKKLPEAILRDTTEENTINLEDVINNNTESYVQIPSTLDSQGDLPPLYIGPLPAGNYWLLITLAGNEITSTEPKATEPEKILSASNFQVLEYEMEARTPTSPKEGENIQVNLTLKNASAQGSYTYWAVLIKEESYTANKNNSPGETRVETKNLLKRFGSIFNINSINSESKEKSGLENEIQNLIGEGNGTISIGEENQSNLSLTTSALLPGNYLLFAGAYEKDRGLAGIVQKKLTIY